MHFSSLTPGRRLSVRRTDMENGPDAPWRVSQLLEWPNGDELIIAAPLMALQAVQWAPGTVIECTYVEPDRGVWHIPAIVSEAVSDNEVAGYRVTALREPERQQRREHFRLDCTLDIPMTVADADESEDDGPPIHGRTRDISGGGARLVPDQPLPEPSELDLTLEVDGYEIRAHGRLIRCDSTDPIGDDRQVVSVQFTKLAPTDQDRLIQYIFRCQKQRLARERKGQDG